MGAMGMRPEAMERWGVAAIFKESAKLLHKHHRLFLPFYLAFFLTSSMAAVFQALFLAPSNTPFLFNSVKSSFTPSQGTDTPDEPAQPVMATWILFVVINVLASFGMAGAAYAVAFIYSTTDTDDSITTKKIFKSLPFAFLRMYVTRLWTALVFFLLYIASMILGAILYIIISAAAGDLNPVLIVMFAPLFFLVCTVFLAAYFVLADLVAVLEPESFGREALKRSTRMVRVGRAGTAVAVLISAVGFSVALTFPTQAIAAGKFPLGVEIVLGALVGGLQSVCAVYFNVVLVVTYFVYKARGEAVSSSIPVFNRADTADHPYNPLVPQEV